MKQYFAHLKLNKIVSYDDMYNAIELVGGDPLLDMLELIHEDVIKPITPDDLASFAKVPEITIVDKYSINRYLETCHANLSDYLQKEGSENEEIT